MKTTDPTLAALYRLKARLGKIRAHCLRESEAADEATMLGAHLASLLRSKAAVVMQATELIDREIARAKGQP